MKKVVLSQVKADKQNKEDGCCFNVEVNGKTFNCNWKKSISQNLFWTNRIFFTNICRPYNYKANMVIWWTFMVPYFCCYKLKCEITLNKKAQHRSWHTAKCNQLYHLKWNINAWDTAMHLHGRHFVRHLRIYYPSCIEILQVMSGVIKHNSVKKRSLYINKLLSYSKL